MPSKLLCDGKRALRCHLCVVVGERPSSLIALLALVSSKMLKSIYHVNNSQKCHNFLDCRLNLSLKNV